MEVSQVEAARHPKNVIQVAVGAISDPRGRILLTRRPDHAHQGGLWEFPGGKLEPGEALARGLERELYEELGIRLRSSTPLIRVHHHYGDRQVLLDVHRVTGFTGEPHGREGQPLRWVHPEAMEAELFPAADRPIITALRLSDRMLITGPDPARVNEFLERLARALASGVRLVQLRAPGLDAEAYRALAAAAAELCRRHGARMLVNPPLDTLEPPEGVGLHLSSRRLLAAQERPPGGASLVGASCHNAEELGRAQSLGLDYALLSSVLPTASHPHAAPLGWEKFAELVERAALPVYALGGMTQRHIAVARQCGGQGIAAIGGLWPEAV
jgi:8-oxo-dGTP diphosphatase